MLSKKQHTIKRSFDLILALLILPIVSPIVFFLWIIASASTQQNGWFCQERIGFHGKTFILYKLRSLKTSKHNSIIEIKNAETRFGRWLRTTKLDELPQVFNILKGDMSWVGPRPDVAGYADVLEGEDRIILRVKPGMTGPATLKYRNEDALLLAQNDPNAYNDTIIWPDKVAINRAYVQHWSFFKDLGYLWKSIV